MYLDDVHHHNLSDRIRLYILKRQQNFISTFLALYYSMDSFQSPGKLRIQGFYSFLTDPISLQILLCLGVPVTFNLDPPKIGSPGTNFFEIFGPPLKICSHYKGQPHKGKSVHVSSPEGTKVEPTYVRVRC